MNQISLDLPDYLHTSYSIATSKSVRFSKKPLKTQLYQGVSIEAPDFFKIPKTRVLSPDDRKDLLCSQGERILSDLKRSQVTESKNFHYSDIKSSTYDYDSIPFLARTAMKVDKNPRLKRTGGFFKKYEKELDRGFGVHRGEFTVETCIPKVVRDHPRKIRNLEEFLRKTGKVRIVCGQSNTPSARAKGSAVRHVVRKEKNHEIVNPLKELDSFEARLQMTHDLAEKRKIYVINRVI